MSTPVSTSSTDSQMHNNIMAAGSKDRPPMLGPGRYSQWRSRFLRYTKASGMFQFFNKASNQNGQEGQGQCKRILALLAKYIQAALQTYQQQPSNFLQTPGKTEDTNTRYNHRQQTGSWESRTMTLQGARENSRQTAKQGCPLQAEQADWLEDTDEEIDEQELEAHYSYMEKIQEVSPEESSSTGQPLEQLIVTLLYGENKNDFKAIKESQRISDSMKLEKCKTNLDETNNAWEANSSHQKQHDELVKKEFFLTKSQLERYLKDVNARTKKPKVVPISASKPKRKANKSVATPIRKQLHRYHYSELQEYHKECERGCTTSISPTNVVPISASKPKRKANKSVATPHKKTVASDTTIQKSKSYHKELYENTNQEWKWWIAKRCPSGYKWTQKPLRTKKIWMPKIRKEDVSTSISPTIDIVSRITNIVQLILFIVDSGCTKHMTGNLKLLCNFVEKFLGTVRFGNDQFAPILGYGDLNQGNVTIKRVYYVEGLNHNLFSVGQFCDADLEVAFRKSTCFVRDLQGNDLLTGNRGSDLYTISLQETTSSTPICFMAKASPTQAWLWHRRLSHLNFDYITLLSKKDIVTGLPKLKYVKDQLCSSCEMSKAKRSSFKSKAVPSSKGRLNLLHMDLCGPMRVASINGKKYILMKEKRDPCVMVGYSTQSKGYRVYNKRTRLIVESIHIKFDEIKEMMSDHNSSDLAPQRQEMSAENVTSGLVPQGHKASDF
ncbi:retrovirus-related pol polyprotein from transposon TNT 1-94 [Tanacetum coccineum]